VVPGARTLDAESDASAAELTVPNTGTPRVLARVNSIRKGKVLAPRSG